MVYNLWQTARGAIALETPLLAVPAAAPAE
jgi:hypothetical protein